MAFWGVEVKPGESYIQPRSHSNARLLRITKATLGNCHHSGWSMVQYTASDKKKNVVLCALNPKITAVCRLELEFKEDDNFVLSAHGQSPIHLSGYYIHSHNDGQRHHMDNSTGKNAEIPQSRDCKPIQTEEALRGELKLQQDARINGHNNGDHRFSNEWNNHDKDANTGHENSGLPHGTSWNTKEVFKKTGSEDEDHYDDLPILHAFEKRRAAKNGGAKIHTKKRKYSWIPGKEKFLSVQNNLMDQLNEQGHSKMIESNAVRNKDDITKEENTVHTASLVKNATHNEGHDGVTNQILVQSGPALKISDEGRCFTVAAKKTVKKHGNKGENENRTRKLDRELMQQQDAQINGHNNGDHLCSNEWNKHVKDADIDREKNGLPHVFKKLTGSEDDDHDDDLPIMVAFEKRRDAKNDGAKIQTKKRNCGTPGKEKFPRVQNNVMDQLNEQRHSKMMESNAVRNKDDITKEENIVHTASLVKNATQNEGHDGVTNQIIVQSGPAVKISDEGHCFTVAAKKMVKKHGNKGKNENRTRKLDRELMQQQDAQINGHNNGDHLCSNEWNKHVKDADIDREKNGLPHVFKKVTGSEDEDHDDDLPIMVAFEKRRDAKNDGAKIQTKKRNCETLGKEKFPRVQNNVMDQLNEQGHSKMMESNAVRNKDDITKEENIVQTASLVKNATQNEGHDGVRNQIIVLSGPAVKNSDEGRCFTVAAKKTVKKHGNKGENENHTRKLDRELMQQQDAQINGHNNGDHLCSNEWNKHVKDADIDREKNGLPHVFKKLTGSEDDDHDDDLPIMLAFEKRRDAKNDGAKIQTKKRNCGTPGKEKFPRVQNNVMDQLNEQGHSKMMESNAVRNKDDITKEENIVQTASLVKNATQNEGHDGVTNQIIVQSGPAVKVSGEGLCFTVAAEYIVKKHDDKGKNRNRTQKLENGLQMKDIIVGNDDSEIASSGDKVYIRYMAWVISTGNVINHAGSLINFEIGDGNVIRGLDIGISGMRVGGKRSLTIPPLLGYGDKAKGEIPANSYLMYEVDLVSVKKCARTAKEAPACMLDA